MSQPVTILYIGGRGRSGSTLLARMLGQVPGFINVGELRWVWERGFRENQLCGCEQPFHSCEFWNAVGHVAFGGPENADVEKILALRPALDRTRHIPRYALIAETGMRGRKTDELLMEYGALLERLYRAIQSVSGARVIVDSSKSLPYAFLLNVLPFADLRVVHLVRDSRGVGYSWSTSPRRPEIVNREVLMPRFSPFRTSLEWYRSNLLLDPLSRSASLSLLRYEDLVRDPNFYVTGALAQLGLGKLGSLSFVDGQEVLLAEDHTASGNPNRFRTGTVRLRADEEWKAKMDNADKYLVTFLTAPLLLRYGYLHSTREKSR